MSTDHNVNTIIRRFKDLKSQRDLYNDMWDNITEFVLPNRGDFAYRREKAGRRDRRLFDSTAIRANEFLSATLKEGIMPLHEQWGRIESMSSQINQMDDFAAYFDQINTIIYRELNNPSTNFHSQNHELFLDLSAYGTAIMYIDDDKGKGLRFKTIHLSEIFISEDKNGMVDTVFREFCLTPRQAAQQWGVENLSPSVQNLLIKNPDDKVEFLHCVKPNEDYDDTTSVATKLPFASYYCELETEHVLERSGYHEMPYKIPRWFKFVGEIYGRSPAWGAMPDIMMINTLKNILIRASQKAADPTYLMADDGVVLPLDTRPGGVVFGGIDPVTGRPRVQTLPNDARFDVTYKLMETVQLDIRNAFYVDPLALRDTDRMTATEVVERRDEQLRFIGPQVGRVQTEYIGPLLQRVYGILDRQKRFPKLTPEMQKILDSSGLDIAYSAPLFNTEKRQEAQSLQRTLQAITPFLQLNPALINVFDQETTTRNLALNFGTPASFIKDVDVYEQEKAALAQQQQAMQQAALDQQNSQTMMNMNKGEPKQ